MASSSVHSNGEYWRSYCVIGSTDRHLRLFFRSFTTQSQVRFHFWINPEAPISHISTECCRFTIYLFAGLFWYLGGQFCFGPSCSSASLQRGGRNSERLGASDRRCGNYIPQGLKAHIRVGAVTARLKPCPCYKTWILGSGTSIPSYTGSLARAAIRAVAYVRARLRVRRNMTSAAPRLGTRRPRRPSQ